MVVEQCNLIVLIQTQLTTPKTRTVAIPIALLFLMEVMPQSQMQQIKPMSLRLLLATITITTTMCPIRFPSLLPHLKILRWIVVKQRNQQTQMNKQKIVHKVPIRFHDQNSREFIMAIQAEEATRQWGEVSDYPLILMY